MNLGKPIQQKPGCPHLVHEVDEMVCQNVLDGWASLLDSHSDCELPTLKWLTMERLLEVMCFQVVMTTDFVSQVLSDAL